MTKPIELIVNIPFAGFYESFYSAEIDHAEEQQIENMATESDHETDEMSQPEELRLTEHELSEIFIRHTDYSAAYAKVARWYAAAFDQEASEAIGIKLGLRFESMTSPREYNFETDRLFCYVPLSAMRGLLKASAAEGHATLRHVIKEQYTSRSGFHSFYRTDLAEWLQKPLRDWDYNELGTLLRASLARGMAAGGIDEDEFEDAVRYATMGDEGAYEAWSEAVDWPAVEAAKAEARADKLREANIERALGGDDGTEPENYHCEHTPDLFGPHA